MDICTTSAPPRFDVGEPAAKHWAACWLYGPDQQTGKPFTSATPAAATPAAASPNGSVNGSAPHADSDDDSDSSNDGNESEGLA
jgi:hypothetical protein